MIFHQPHNSRKNFTYNAIVYHGSGYASHFHGNYELIYAMTATVDMTVNGVECRLTPGEMLLISPYVVHSFSVESGKDAWVGVFSDDFIPAFAGKSRSTQYESFRAAPDVEAFLRERLFYEGRPSHYLLIGALYLVMHECCKSARPMQTESKQEFMNRVVSFIAENYTGDLSLASLAAALGYEYHYASSLFHRCFSMDFKKFLNHYRVENACLLLSEWTEDVTEVYKKCGFAGIRNFNRVFKEVTGMTPTAFRKRKYVM